MHRTTPISRRTALLAASLAVLTASAARAGQPPQVGQAGKDVIWIPTSEPVVERMLKMAQVTDRDLVVDLGAGDGRLVIMAAKKFGARARGIEYDARLVAHARALARKEGLGPPRFRMEKADLFTADFGDATVVGVYLLSEMLLRLRPTFLRMRPGTRIVSHHFRIDGWEPDEVSWIDQRGVYLYIVPAAVAGGWRLVASDGLATDVYIEQSIQRIRGRAELPTVKAGLREPHIRGDAIRFSFIDEQGLLREFSGRVAADRVEGTFQAGDLAGTWTATRLPAGGAPPPAP